MCVVTGKTCVVVGKTCVVTGKTCVVSGKSVCRSGIGFDVIHDSDLTSSIENNYMSEKVFFGDSLASDEESSSTKLTVSSKATVQPVALMRLNVFVPASRSAKGELERIDATAELMGLEYSRREGYNNIRISGERLNMAVDFKVWVGVIHAFSKYGLQSNLIKLTFTEFAKMCGFESKRIDRRLRANIDISLGKLRGKTITFTKSNSDGVQKTSSTGLLKTGSFDAENDVVELEADSRLWELYQADYTVLLRHKPMGQLQRKEVAQAIYTYIESLPLNPAPISFARIMERLALLSPVREQRRMIKQALEQLQTIGYLRYSITKKDGENYVLVHSRTPSLTVKECVS